MTPAAWPVQVAVVARLTADDPLTAVISGVYDEVPENARYPYVTVGEATEVPDSTHGQDGTAVTLTLHIWTRRYRGFREALDILAHLLRVLHRRPLVVAGFRDVSIAHTWHQTMRDPDPQIRHIPVRFRVWLTSEE